MFHTALYRNAPVAQPSLEELQLSLESHLSQLTTAADTMERLSLARESYASLPDDNINVMTTSLLTSGFVGLDASFTPPGASLALESALGEKPTQLRRVALETADGIIGRVVEFVKKLIKHIREFLKSLLDRLTGRESSRFSFKFDFSSAVNRQITPSADYACAVIGGKLSPTTLNTAFHSLLDVSHKVEQVTKQICGNLSNFDFDPAKLHTLADGLVLTPSTDWPGEVKYTINEDGEAALSLPEQKDRPSDLAPFEVSVMSFPKQMASSLTQSNENVCSTLKLLDGALSKVEKEADAIEASRADGANDVANNAHSPLAMKAYLKAVSVLSTGISGGTLRNLGMQIKVFNHLDSQMRLAEK